jgi:hypothetical protein
VAPKQSAPAQDLSRPRRSGSQLRSNAGVTEELRHIYQKTREPNIFAQGAFPPYPFNYACRELWPSPPPDSSETHVTRLASFRAAIEEGADGIESGK